MKRNETHGKNNKQNTFVLCLHSTEISIELYWQYFHLPNDLSQTWQILLLESIVIHTCLSVQLYPMIFDVQLLKKSVLNRERDKIS